MTDRQLLGIYLNDHLAGATAGRELAARLASQNEGTPYAEALTALAEEIAEDRETLRDLMKALDVSESRLKVAGGWAAERLGRLKLNGRVTGYSPLSRLVELEGLWAGAQAKLSLWQVLRACADREPGLDAEQLATLEQRARAQLDTIERERLRAGREAFAGEPAPAS